MKNKHILIIFISFLAAVFFAGVVGHIVYDIFIFNKKYPDIYKPSTSLIEKELP